MKPLAFVLAFVLASGCLPAEHPYGDERELTTTWTLLGPGDAPGVCPAGFTTLVVETCADESLSDCDREMVPCEPTGSAVRKVYTSGHMELDSGYDRELTPIYWVFVSVTDPTGAVARVRSQPIRVDLAEGDGRADAVLYPDAGTLGVTWSLRSMQTGATLPTCAAADVDDLELSYAKQDENDGSLGPVATKRWPCSLGTGVTPAVAPGDYAGTLRAFREGAEVATSDAYLFDVDVGSAETRTIELTITDR